MWLSLPLIAAADLGSRATVGGSISSTSGEANYGSEGQPVTLRHNLGTLRRNRNDVFIRRRWTGLAQNVVLIVAALVTLFLVYLAIMKAR